jgi:hypothetical protein
MQDRLLSRKRALPRAFRKRLHLHSRKRCAQVKAAVRLWPFTILSRCS